jgi:hypothetical protein
VSRSNWAPYECEGLAKRSFDPEVADVGSVQGDKREVSQCQEADSVAAVGLQEQQVGGNHNGSK